MLQKPWRNPPHGPILKHYEGKWLDKVAMPVGGIGTGSISIGGNGQWKDVELMNKPGIGFYGAASPKLAPCFMVFTKNAAGKKNAKALMGPIPVSQFQGMQGSEAPNNGFPRFRTVAFDVAYPFAQISLNDESMPVSAKLKTFNPFIPCDAESSGIPVAVIRYEIQNKTAQTLTVTVAGSMDNFIGMDGSVVEFNSFDRSINPLGAKKNRIMFRQEGSLSGLFMSSDSVDKDASAWGTMALTTTEIRQWLQDQLQDRT